MAFSDYSSVFGSGGLINTISSPSNLIRFTTSLAEKSAWAIYKNNYNLIRTEGQNRFIPDALTMLMGTNIASDLMAGGYQPHIGAYMAHKVGVATYTVLNRIKNIIAPELHETLRLRTEELLETATSTGIEDDLIKSILSTFATVGKKTPQYFYDIFYKDFNSAYLTSDRFLCLFERDGDVTDQTNKYPMFNRHYQAFLVKNVTIPAIDVENIDMMRLGQKFSIMGNRGTNESISVNYYVDRHNSLYNKLYSHITNDNFKSPNSYYNMYIIINNPYHEKGFDGNSVVGTTNPTGIKMNIINSSFPIVGKEDIISVWKYKGVHVKNINQVTYDNGSPELMNLPVIFNHNGVEVNHYDGFNEIFKLYDFNKA